MTSTKPALEAPLGELCRCLLRDGAGIQTAYLENRSTTTKMELMPCTLGSPLMKSMDTDSHGPSLYNYLIDRSVGTLWVLAKRTPMPAFL